jgi:hypothetical protein
MEVRSSGSPKGNPDRFLAGLPLKIFHNRDIVEAAETGKVFRQRDPFILKNCFHQVSMEK